MVAKIGWHRYGTKLRRCHSVYTKELYVEINADFGIESVENLVANRRNRFSLLTDTAKQTIKCQT